MTGQWYGGGGRLRVQQFHLLIKIRNGKVVQIKTRHKFMKFLLHRHPPISQHLPRPCSNVDHHDWL